MSRFFVGQRVRVVAWWRDTPADQAFAKRLIGQEAVVDTPTVRCGGDGGAGVGITAIGEDDWAAPEWGLEPILPEGHRACDEEFKRDLDKLLEGLPA